MNAVTELLFILSSMSLSQTVFAEPGLLTPDPSSKLTIQVDRSDGVKGKQGLCFGTPYSIAEITLEDWNYVLTGGSSLPFPRPSSPQPAPVPASDISEKVNKTKAYIVEQLAEMAAAIRKALGQPEEVYGVVTSPQPKTPGDKNPCLRRAVLETRYENIETEEIDERKQTLYLMKLVDKPVYSPSLKNHEEALTIMLKAMQSGDLNKQIAALDQVLGMEKMKKFLPDLPDSPLGSSVRLKPHLR